MVLIVILIFVLCFLSGLLNSTEDLLKDKYHESIFKNFKHIWFSYDSWKNKYVNRDPKFGRVMWNILGIKIIKPVQFTDWWHFSKMLSLTFLFMSMLLSSTLGLTIGSTIVIITAGLIRNLGFVLGYTKLFKTND